MSWHNVDPIPFEQQADFVRQITHDVRNGLNAIDLQTAFLAEIAGEDAGIKQESAQLREMVRNVTRMLSTLSHYYQQPQSDPIACPVSLLLENLANRVASAHPRGAADVRWPAAPAPTEVFVDVERFTEAMLEIIRNAFDFRVNANPISVTARAGEEGFILEVLEEKPAPELPTAEWPHRFLRSTRRGGYGLGLFRAHAVLAAQNASLDQHHDGKCLVSRVTLPLAPDGR